MAVTTLGRELLRKGLPDGYKDRADRAWTTPDIKKYFTELAVTNPEDYKRSMEVFLALGDETVSTYGREASVSLKDIEDSPDMAALKAGVRSRALAAAKAEPDPAKRGTRLVDSMMADRDGAEASAWNILEKNKNSLAGQVNVGARGSKQQLMQIAMGDYLIGDPDGKAYPWPALRGYGQGEDSFSYWLGAQATRKGFVGTQLATGKAGYLSKQVSNVAHRLMVTSVDGGDPDEGYIVDGSDPDNVGSVLARPVGELPAGTVIRKDHMPLLRGRIVVKSPIANNVAEGITQAAAGWRENGDLPPIGDNVGLNAVKAFTEAATQMALGAKHAGAVTKGKSRPGLSGLPEVNQMIQVPEHFVGGATLAQAAGRVGTVRPLPQGGWSVSVLGVDHYVPPSMDLSVAEGDSVERGLPLSTGTSNPAEVARLRGIGEARRIFINSFKDVLKNNKMSTSRRNMEMLARAFIDRVRIEDDSVPGHILGDVVPYEKLAAGWEPREGSAPVPLDRAAGRYLEKPYLHYTIGTELTPSVVKELREFGHSTVLVHKDPPPFTPVVGRAQAFQTLDEDWVSRMGGEQLMRSVTDAASRGSLSDPKGTSYFSKLTFMGGADNFRSIGDKSPMEKSSAWTPGN